MPCVSGLRCVLWTGITRKLFSQFHHKYTTVFSYRLRMGVRTSLINLAKLTNHFTTFTIAFIVIEEHCLTSALAWVVSGSSGRLTPVRYCIGPTLYKPTVYSPINAAADSVPFQLNAHSVLLKSVAEKWRLLGLFINSWCLLQYYYIKKHLPHHMNLS